MNSHFTSKQVFPWAFIETQSYQLHILVVSRLCKCEMAGTVQPNWNVMSKQFKRTRFFHPKQQLLVVFFSVRSLSMILLFAEGKRNISRTTDESGFVR